VAQSIDASFSLASAEICRNLHITLFSLYRTKISDLSSKEGNENQRRLGLTQIKVDRWKCWSSDEEPNLTISEGKPIDAYFTCRASTKLHGQWNQSQAHEHRIRNRNNHCCRRNSFRADTNSQHMNSLKPARQSSCKLELSTKDSQDEGGHNRKCRFRPEPLCTSLCNRPILMVLAQEDLE